MAAFDDVSFTFAIHEGIRSRTGMVYMEELDRDPQKVGDVFQRILDRLQSAQDQDLPQPLIVDRNENY